ncbi:MAG: metal-dependent hydrolase [Flavobacteriaceae bacterium]|jgi:L-ascorbate metabolism protein UlaG (beta-lactamase superfamily)
MKITFLGHACLQIELQDSTLIIDPFISGNPKNNTIQLSDLKADYILITHAHQDHTLDVEALANQTGATLISNYEIITHYGAKGIQGHPMNHGGSYEFDFGELKYVNAIHSSSFADGSYGGQPGGFILSAEGKSIYIAGDTALTYDMKLFGSAFDLSLAILPVGDNFTMGYADALKASQFLNCNRVLGYHFDTFGYIEIDHEVAVNYFLDHGSSLELLEIGESLTL